MAGYFFILELVIVLLCYHDLCKSRHSNSEHRKYGEKSAFHSGKSVDDMIV